MKNDFKSFELYEIYEKSINGKIKRNDIVELWDLDVYDLLYVAYRIKKTYNKNNIDLCCIINAKSGKCPENCAFCAQSIHSNTKIDIYGLKPKEEIVKFAKYMDQYSNRFSIVTSGKKITYDEFERILDTIKEIKNKTNLKVCASLGLLDKDPLKALKELDVRLHNNLETSEDYFNEICTTHDYKDKVKTIEKAKKIGLEVCSGGIFGLGEDFKERIKMFEDLKNLNVEGIALNILNPIEGTRIHSMIEKGEIKRITPIEALKSIALCRIMMPEKEIRLCGGREPNLKDLQSLSLLALDGLMIGNYLTTSGRAISDDLKMIRNMGFMVNL
ncbi:MAG: biotin synthase [Methanothermococcus sp.]|uniref:biotin synthase BioB n=1 Tax=Methanothermococcus sp. TaxID=2614238 RepID=UPI00258D0A67|nr:biotin synthase BioB [Methanothermococcus sp.]MDK2790714.1 biotin synthase [Methanothermococcus sp.]